MRKQARVLVAAALLTGLILAGYDVWTEHPISYAATSSSYQVFLPAVIASKSASPTNSALPKFDHIFVVVEENKSYSEIIGSSSAPYINSLAKQYALATNYHAVRHPSLPNYLTLIGGSTFGITTDCSPSTCPVNARNLADNLEAAGKSWKGYMESMPSLCGINSSGDYVTKHNPFVYFNNIRTNTVRCNSHLQSYTALPADLATAATTPDLVFITPNLCSDMHNCSVSTGDTWLRNNLPAIFNSPAWKTQNSVLFLLWDEDDSSASNHVAALIIGPDVKGGYQSSKTYGHYNLLHTIEALWGLPALTPNDASAPVMNDFWK